MIGVILVSADGYISDKNGRVDWGPMEDKVWLRHFIRDKIVFTGVNTWRSIRAFDIVKVPYYWVVGEPTPNCQVHFGGMKSLNKYPPDVLIIHRSPNTLGLKGGEKFEPTFSMTKLSEHWNGHYTEEVYYVIKE